MFVSDLLIITSIIIFLIFTVGKTFYIVIFYFLTALATYFFLFRNLQKKFGKAVNSSSDHTVQILNESNIGFKQIKILGIEPFFEKRMKKVSSVFAKNSVLNQVITMLQNTFSNFGCSWIDFICFNVLCK